jgi:hypothetical protein
LVPASEQQRAPALDASPDRPAFGIEYRGALRATVGAEMPIWGHRANQEWAVLVLPLIELHNEPDPDSFVPNEYWRARIGLETWWTPWRRAADSFAVGLAVEHESDHSTARVDSTWGFTSLNDLALRTLTIITLGPADLALGAQLAVLFASCTRDPRECRSFAGATTLGAGASVVADFARSVGLAGVGPFLACSASGVVEAGEVASEKRLAVHAGVALEGPHGGLWQLFGLLFVGNDVGIHRATNLRKDLGVGLRWSPD